MIANYGMTYGVVAVVLFWQESRLPSDADAKKAELALAINAEEG